MGAVARRLRDAAVTLAGVVVLTFLLTRLLPGDPAAFFASHPTADAATVAAIRAQLGLDQPLWRQFLLYVGGVLRGDLGLSITTGQPVTRELLARLPASAELTLAATALAMAAALPLGIAAATRPGSWVDHLCRMTATAGAALPTFVIGLLLIHLFYHVAGWAPEPIGRLDPFLAPPPAVTGLLLADTLLAGDLTAFASALGQLLLPAVTLATFALAPLARMTRAAMLEALAADHIRAARARGLPPRAVVLTHALRTALVPVLTTLGLVLSTMVGGGVLVERVFAWPGIGAYALDALVSLDYAPVQGFLLATAAILVLVNLAVDLLSAAVDPRAGMLRGG